jgi:hypothetical protein
MTGKILSETDLIALRDSFHTRCQAMIEAEAGKPLIRAPIEYGWNDRGNFTRQHSYSILTFAMRAFILNEQLTEANMAIKELCKYYLDNPADVHELHSFHWSGALWTRLWEFFAESGSRHAGSLTSETQTIMLEMMWVWSKKMSRIDETDPAETWRIRHSENHHMMGVATCWQFAKFLREQHGYCDLEYDEGGTAQEHYDAWTDYFKEYLRERVKKGLFLEIASKDYNAHTMEGIYNFLDFSDDATLRKRARQFLDLYWAAWAEEQLDGVRGGGKTRIYQGICSRSSAGDVVRGMAGYYLDSPLLEGPAAKYAGEPPLSRINPTGWVIATSAYRMPLEVMAFALDLDGRGEYEVTQRPLGLAEEGYAKPHFSGLRKDYGGVLRYSYCTPDFVMGTLMVEARPKEDWTSLNSGNRWHGVIFRGHPDACIVPECVALDSLPIYKDHGINKNQQWSVQKKGTLIVQKLESPKYGGDVGDMRVWFSNPGLSEPVEVDGWVFVESDGASAAVRAVSGGYAWDGPAEDEDGRWLNCDNDLTPVIIEVARTQDLGFEAFQSAVISNMPDFENRVLRYQGLAGNAFTFYADYSQPPEINGSIVDYAPSKVFDSPLVQSEWDSGVVEIRYGDRMLELNFNTE